MLGLPGVATGSAGCDCEATFSGTVLGMDATDCRYGGDLADSSACRQTAIDAIGSTAVDLVVVETTGVRRIYRDEASTLLRSAAHFADRVARRDARLASTARRDPVTAATEADGRAGLVSELASTTGLSSVAGSESSYSDLLRPLLAPVIVSSYLDPTPPPAGTLADSRVTESGARVRIYDRPGGQPAYHIEPIEYTLDEGALSTLAEAKARLAEPTDGSFPGPHEAVSAVAGPECPVDTLGQILRKHTTGYGVFEDLFADPALEEVFVNAPATANQLHVRVAGSEMVTNAQLTEEGAARLAAKLRGQTGRPFSRASPTIDASIADVGTREAIRVAGVREPASDGLAFALRAEGTDTWRLSTLVEYGTLTPQAAGLLSVAMARGAAILIAGPRGAGKTTMASALLWELAPSTRLLAIEDTPELPIHALQAADRDVQRLEADSGSRTEMDPETALRTALRFGDGALAVGEVRGSEASVLYEAMRVGAASDTVLGTIHGDGYEGVKERVVSDLGVPESSFAATDLLVTLAPMNGGKQVTSIEEVTETGGSTLFAFDGTDLAADPRLERGNSTLVADLTRPDQTYAQTLHAIWERAGSLDGSPLRRQDSGQASGEPVHG